MLLLDIIVLLQSLVFIKNLMKTFGSAGSKFGCHPDRKKQKFTEVSCGSLGHGLGVACGIALASKIKK